MVASLSISGVANLWALRENSSAACNDSAELGQDWQWAAEHRFDESAAVAKGRLRAAGHD